MIKFAKSTPPAAKAWLEQALADAELHTKDRDALLSLAEDNRMTALWEKLRQWPPCEIEWLMQGAILSCGELLLEILAEPPGRRIGLAPEDYNLFARIDIIADMIESTGDKANELWGAPGSEFAKRVRAFARQAFERAEILRSAFDDIPEAARHGRQGHKGRSQITFRLAMTKDLAVLAARNPALLTMALQDEITAILTNVLFQLQPKTEVNPKSIRIYRQRRQRHDRGNNSA